jgi:hypothetical protein
MPLLLQSGLRRFWYGEDLRVWLAPAVEPPAPALAKLVNSKALPASVGDGCLLGRAETTLTRA